MRVNIGKLGSDFAFHTEWTQKKRIRSEDSDQIRMNLIKEDQESWEWYHELGIDEQKEKMVKG